MLIAALIIVFFIGFFLTLNWFAFLTVLAKEPVMTGNTAVVWSSAVGFCCSFLFYFFT